MEFVSKSWEDAWLAPRRPPLTPPCARGNQCKGVTARTVHGRALGKTLDAFQLPSGRLFAECLLCLRARATERWYEALWRDELPAEPVHEWAVRVDEPGEYDAAACIGPSESRPRPKKCKYVGVVAPFPRYDETTLLVRDGGFAQLGVDYVAVPRLLRPNDRIGARPLGFHHLFRTTFALVHAGYVSRPPLEELHPDMIVARLYQKCLPRSHYGSSSHAWIEAAGGAKSWIDGVVRASALGLYPHCKVRPVDPNPEGGGEWPTKHVVFFVREHITFLVERDSPELYAAVCRAYPSWPAFEADVRATCDAVRKQGHVSKRVHPVRRFDAPVPFLVAMRKRFATPPEEGGGDEGGDTTRAREGFQRMQEMHESGADPVEWMRAQLTSHCAEIERFVARRAWKDRFDAREIVVAGNRTAQPVWWYVCGACGAFKSDTKRGGCLDVRLDLDDATLRCHKKRGVGRKPVRTLIQRDDTMTTYTMPGCRGVVVRRAFGTNIVNVDFHAFVCCSVCERAAAPMDWTRVVRGHVCDDCITAGAMRNVHALACEMCGVKVAEDAFAVSVLDGSTGLRTVRFCRAHARPKLKRHAEVWSLDMLMQEIYDGGKKRSRAAGSADAAQQQQRRQRR